MDGVLGWVLDELNPEDDLVICSDHGFNSFRRQVDLNSWLLRNGYLSLQDGGAPNDAGPVFHGVDWSATKAYAIGLAGIFINQRGREKHGIVPPGETHSLSRKIAGDLMEMTDEETGEKPVAEALPSKRVYEGDRTEHAPEVLVGYEKGYRISWSSAIGGFDERVLSDNPNKWSGDHGIKPDRIPGTLMTNFSPKNGRGLALRDIVPGIFNRLGLAVPKSMDGRQEWI